jgi:hypothetical protein
MWLGSVPAVGRAICDGNGVYHPLGVPDEDADRRRRIGRDWRDDQVVQNDLAAISIDRQARLDGDRRAVAGDVNVQSVNDAESMKHLQVSPMFLPVILLFFAEIIRGEQTAGK